MDINTILGLALLGTIAGVISGMIGIGGGIVVVPALVFIFGLSQKAAQGTSLAMLLPPIGLLAVLDYQKNGNVRWDMAIVLILFFVLGSYIGAKFINKLNTDVVKKIFAVFMILVALKYLFFDGKKHNPTAPSATTEQTST